MQTGLPLDYNGGIIHVMCGVYLFLVLLAGASERLSCCQAHP